MPISIISNTARSQNTNGALIIPPATTSTTLHTNLADVDATGLNNNDVLVYDANTGKFRPIDIEIINDNDGGVF